MEAIREIITGNKLAGIIDLPEEFKASELEIIILPVKNKKKPVEKTQPINLEDLPRHKMGRERSPIDRDHIYINER
ncbi:MAG: hypothetical protein PVH61_08620 [Candidatus Aminicenantes bacterium]|jgi:hypothetical protein